MQNFKILANLILGERKESRKQHGQGSQVLLTLWRGHLLHLPLLVVNPPLFGHLDALFRLSFPTEGGFPQRRSTGSPHVCWS